MLGAAGCGALFDALSLPVLGGARGARPAVVAGGARGGAGVPPTFDPLEPSAFLLEPLL
ncbi:MAG: hypothetical protein IPN17_21075 [Deltaproteobacteria bacterium]|nr:hypothetical protein [Deltaproteobacteria bacterium]